MSASNNSKQLHVARCSRCGASHSRAGQRECPECHAATMRASRAELRERQEATARAFAQFDKSLAAAEGAFLAALSDMRAIIAAGKGAA